MLSRSHRRNGAGPKVKGSRHFQLLRWHRALALVSTSALLVVLGVTAIAGPSSATGTALPCDTFAAGSAPCVASYSTVRALFAAYNGALYRVTRASDGTGSDIGLLAAGGYANAATQDSFCAGTVCTITTLYDQSSHLNHLTVGTVGSAGSSDVGARADALPMTVAGHNVYGILVNPGVGYRRNNATGLAVNGQPESMYMVASGTYATNYCCFDFGNVEPSGTDTGAGHMDALIISTSCGASPCNGVGPWIQGDLENGVFTGNGTSNMNALSQNSPFITAVLRNNGQTQYALDGGNATNATLTSFYSGALPSGYAPMHQEGAITLGTGGDNSNAAPGAFFEGAITTGYASNTAVADLQSSISSVTYSGTSGGGAGVGVTGPGGKCVDVAGADVGVNGTNVDISTCLHDAADQHWQYIRALSGGGTPEYVNDLKTLGRCLDIKNNARTSGTQVDLWDCNGTGGQAWVQQSNGTLLNPQSGLCLTSPGGSITDGTVLDIETCTGGASQLFRVTLGQVIQSMPIAAPGGKCIDVNGLNTGGNGAAVDMWDCQRESTDQQWWQNADKSITTLGRCLEIIGNVTTIGTKIQLYDCNGLGGQKWKQQADGSLLNPQSGLCLDDQGNTTNGTILQINTCNGGAAQKFFVSGGHPINANGGKCVDVNGNDLYGNWQAPKVQMWDCISTAVDQHWVFTNNTVQTMTRCLDISGNSSAIGAKVDLFNCNGVGGQTWVPQANGSLLNPQSGLCLDDPSGNTTNGTQLQIYTCNGNVAQQFTW